MTFPQKDKLEQVYSQTIRSDSSTHAINVAKQNGFPGRGHLRRHYRDLFGKLPSKTLNHSLPTSIIKAEQSLTKTMSLTIKYSTDYLSQKKNQSTQLLAQVTMTGLCPNQAFRQQGHF